MDWKKVLVHILAVLNILPVFHELAHTLTALAFGWKVNGWMITEKGWATIVTYPVNAPLPQLILLYLSGGLAQAIIGLTLLVYTLRKDIFMPEEKFVIALWSVFSIIYAIAETTLAFI